MMATMTANVMMVVNVMMVEVMLLVLVLMVVMWGKVWLIFPSPA